jgi:hypothetical protein
MSTLLGKLQYREGDPINVNSSSFGRRFRRKAQNQGPMPELLRFTQRRAKGGRFNDIAPRTPRRGQGAKPRLSAGNAMPAWTDKIDRVLRPDDAQRAKLQALQSAASQAADTIKAACPSDVPPSPPARMAAGCQRLQAMLQGVEAIRACLRINGKKPRT